MDLLIEIILITANLTITLIVFIGLGTPGFNSGCWVEGLINLIITIGIVTIIMHILTTKMCWYN